MTLTNLHTVTSRSKCPRSYFSFSFLVGCCKRHGVLISIHFLKYFYTCIAFTQNTHRNILDKRKSLATVSRIQTEPQRWTDGEMGTGSLKSHISIYICCLTGESVTAKPNKQLLAKRTRPNATILSLHFTHTHTHT